MKQCLKMEVRKSIFNKYFGIVLVICCLLALLSAISVISNYQGAMEYARAHYFENGTMMENDLFPTWSCYQWWIGGESLSLVYSLFFTLLPIFGVLPYGASYAQELKSGYLRNVLTRTKKLPYFAAKLAGAFLSGGLVIALPLCLNFAIVSAFLPTSVPHVNYNFYNHVPFGSLWADLFYSIPFLYVVLYILLNGVFAGLFALTTLALSFTIKNRFVILFLPFLAALGLDYFSGILLTGGESLPWPVEIAPTVFLHAGQLKLPTVGWMVALEAVILVLLTVPTILIKGKRNEVF